MKSQISRFKPIHHSLFLTCTLICMGCSGSGPSPLRDQLQLVYKSQYDTCTLRFNETEQKLYQLTMEGEGCAYVRPSNKPEQFLVKPNLRDENGNPLLWGQATFIWHPPKKLVAGKRVGNHPIHAVKKWKDWNVAEIVAKIALMEATFYYDTETGWLVGMEKNFAGDKSQILILQSEL